MKKLLLAGVAVLICGRLYPATDSLSFYKGKVDSLRTAIEKGSKESKTLVYECEKKLAAKAAEEEKEEAIAQEEKKRSQKIIYILSIATVGGFVFGLYGMRGRRTKKDEN